MNNKKKSRAVQKSPDTKTFTDKKKSPWIFYIILVLIPVVFFILLEAGLRIFHYGYDTTQWVQATSSKLTLNPEIAHRYFYSIKNVPYSNQNFFDKVKSENSFRVFVLGESSAAGYPYLPLGSFASYLQKRLEILYPESKIEVVNLSMTAINSYALRDMFSGVLEQKPDLVLIYTGHNEYYGALGVGSMESIGSSPGLVNFILSLNKFKTVELLRNLMQWVSGVFASKPAAGAEGTLMSRIARDQYIAYGSRQYKAGLNQFESNMRDILQMAKDNGVPVIMGTLTSNLKDQKPFVSVSAENIPRADAVYEKALKALSAGELTNAKKLFRQAKDLDGLRFRAPEDFNGIIRRLGKEYSSPIVEIDSAFNSISPGGIVGDNLMTDHLHPVLKGYQYMAKLYYETMRTTDILPKSSAVKVRTDELDSLTVKRYKFTRLDSMIAVYRVLSLKNDWPFLDRKFRRPAEELVKPKDYIDSIAMNFFYNDLNWEEAHRRAAEWYLRKNDINNFVSIMDVLIEEYPVIRDYYHHASEVLMEHSRYDEAFDYLMRSYRLRPDAYSSKWLGIISLSRGKNDEALSYLKTSLQFDGQDAQVLYNLSGAYVNKEDYTSALEAIDRCLEIEPGFPQAGNLKQQLTMALSAKKR